MSVAGISFEEIEASLMKDKDFKAEYDKLKPEYDAVKHDITEKVSLYTALKLTSTFNDEKVYIKYPGQYAVECKTVSMKEIREKWDMHSIMVSELTIYWKEYDSVVFLFTIDKQDEA